MPHFLFLTQSSSFPAISPYCEAPHASNLPFKWVSLLSCVLQKHEASPTLRSLHINNCHVALSLYAARMSAVRINIHEHATSLHVPSVIYNGGQTNKRGCRSLVLWVYPDRRSSSSLSLSIKHSSLSWRLWQEGSRRAWTSRESSSALNNKQGCSRVSRSSEGFEIDWRCTSEQCRCLVNGICG